MDGLPWDHIGIGSGWALVAFCVWLIFTGRLVPKSTLEEVKHERDEWRAQSRIESAHIVELTEQVRTFGELGKLVEHTMGALQHSTGIKPDANGDT